MSRLNATKHALFQADELRRCRQWIRFRCGTFETDETISTIFERLIVTIADADRFVTVYRLNRVLCRVAIFIAKQPILG